MLKRRPNSRDQVLIGIFLVLTMISWWFSRGIQEGLPVEASDKGAPDYFLEQVQVMEMDDQGRPLQQLVAERSVHFERQEQIHLTQPVMRLMGEEGPPWVIHARRGELSRGGRDLLLVGQVIIQRAESVGHRPVRLVTRDLLVDTEQQTAETDRPVTANSWGDEIKAVGFKVRAKPELRVHLQSRVRGHHVL
jgi:LPS export ABC transporter protein LptC